jgi:hypothetical protein
MRLTNVDSKKSLSDRYLGASLFSIALDGAAETNVRGG